MKHKIICGDTIKAMQRIKKGSVDMVLTSPPYWGLRDYGADTATDWQGGWHGQLGLEPTPELYIEHLRMIFTENKRVLKKTGTCWVNIGDSYIGSSKGIGSSPDPKWEKARNDDMKHKTDWKGINLPAKCMCCIPERFIFMMIDLGYILRNKIIWHKPNPMPSSVKDRFNTTYEMLYFFSKSKKYWFDLDAVRVPHKTNENRAMGIVRERTLKYKSKKNLNPEAYNSPRARTERENYQAEEHFYNLAGKNLGDVWEISTQPFPEAHFAVFPEKLCEKPILAGCPAEVCKHCGMARVRITKTEYDVLRKSKIQDQPKIKAQIEQGANPNLSGFKFAVGKAKYETIGWTDCPCSDKNKYEPGIVLDPFSGSGTVGVVAEKLGRSSISIDIKKDYCEIAYKRLCKEVEQSKLNREQSTIEKVGF